MEAFKLKNHTIPNYLLKQEPSYVDRIETSYENDSDLAIAVRDGEFKIMFQTEHNKRYACYLISKFIDMDYETLNKELVFYKNVFNRDLLKQRAHIGDFVGKIGTKYISMR